MLNGVFVCPRRDVWGLVFMFARCIAYITSPHTSHLVRSSVQYTVSCVRSAATYVKCTRILEPIQGLARYRVRFVTFSRGTSPIFARFMMLCSLSYLDSFHVQHPTVLSPTPSWYFSYHSLEHLNFSQLALKYYSKYINK